MQEPLIRDATAADLPALRAIRNAPAQHEAKLAEAAAGTARFLVATRDDTLVAFATLFLRHPVDGPPKSHVPKLSDCHVASDHRSSGVGDALVAAREHIAREAGCESLFVSIDPVENARWMNYFERRGYRPLQPAPYRKRERRIAESGEATEIETWRRDLVLDLTR